VLYLQASYVQLFCHFSYETNVFTGGAGLRYFGTNASSQYREDRVTIYLRAVSTSNGKVLKTVYTTKSILSQEVSAGFFRYVKFKRLLEAETGYTYNEPTEMAITEAVEKAVHSLVLEGLMGSLWELKENNEKTQNLINEYQAEKSTNVEIDYIGRLHEFDHRASLFYSPLVSFQNYLGDYPSSQPRAGFNTALGVGLSKSLYLETGLGYQEVNVENLMNSREFYGDLSLLYLANPSGKLSPIFGVGVGSYYNFGNNIGLSERPWLPYVTYNVGVEYLVTNKTAITGKAYLNQHLTDNYDGAIAGSLNDVIVGLKLGLKFYIGK
jgi:curli production assembly/transport component CsgG